MIAAVKARLTRTPGAADFSGWGREPVLKGSGGAIPVVRHIKDILDIDSIMPGFALEDDAIHAPNEKYNLGSFHPGIRSWVRILEGLSRQTRLARSSHALNSHIGAC